MGWRAGSSSSPVRRAQGLSGTMAQRITSSSLRPRFVPRQTSSSPLTVAKNRPQHDELLGFAVVLSDEERWRRGSPCLRETSAAA
jgi:hypothetical protein